MRQMTWWLISAAVCMHSPLTAAETRPLAGAQPFQLKPKSAEDDAMSARQIERFPTTPLTATQIADILRVSEIGSRWVSGQVSLDDVQLNLGPLERFSVGSDTSYFYKGFEFGAVFDLNEPAEARQSRRGRAVKLTLSELKSASIPRETFEQRLGLVRSVPGELIDGVRKETQLYMRRPIFDNQAPDEIGLYLRLPMPNDSLFDVRATFEYRVIPGQPIESNFDTTTNVRSLSIERWYLTPEEIEEREHAKRVKYGAMNLCTGMICPETGWWQAWTDAGQSGKPFVWWADRKFDMAFHPLPSVGSLVNARFTWVKTYIPSPY